VSNSSQKRLVYVDSCGNPRFISPKAVAAMPSEFGDVLTELCDNLQLAIDCNLTFGGIPTPVALALLRSIEPAHVAIDMAIRSGRQAERRMN
jgi:hypothetical protein